MHLAVAEERVIVSADTDFGSILAVLGLERPSVIQFRRASQRRPEQQAELLVANLYAVAGELEAGAIVTFEQHRIRVRRLPVVRS